MNRRTKILTTTLVICSILIAVDKHIGVSRVLGYGYDHATPPEIIIDTKETKDKTPGIAGRYLYGEISSIDIVIKNSSGAPVWTGQPTSISNKDITTGAWQNWEIADNTLPELPIGVYDITATVTDVIDLTGTYQAKLFIQNDFSPLSVSIESQDSSDDKTSKTEATMKLKNYGEATEYMVSRHSDFSGANWKAIDDSFTVKLDSEEGKYRFYIKLRDASGSESEIFSKSITYQQPRKISVSASKVSRGEILAQKGKRFSKNSDVLLYFSNTIGGYYTPTKVKTDSKGTFRAEYKVNKPAGKYTWYAVDEKTGKKSNKSKYTVR